VLLVATILSVTLGVDALITYQRQESLLLQGLREKAAIQGQFVSSISKEAILSHDYVSLNRYMQDISKIEDIVYGTLFSAKGDNLTSYLDLDNPRIRQAREKLAAPGMRAIVDEINRDPQILTLTYPVMLDDERIADFVIGIDKTRVSRLAHAEFQRQLATSLAIVIVLGLAIYVIFRYSALRPITNLIAGASRVAAGNLSEPVPVTSEDELGRLTRSFNQMMAGLEESLARSNEAMGKLRDLNRTLEMRVQERTARLELAQRIAQMGHWDYVVEEAVFHASAQVHKWLGLQPGRELRPHHLLRAIHPADRQAVINTFKRAIARSEPFEIQFRATIHGGEERIFVVTAERTISEETGHSRLFGIVQDITARAEAEFIAQNALVEKLHAESASEAKSAFLANMSHEIRTPLTAIIGFAETLLEAGHTEEEKRAAIQTVLHNGKHLLQLINEILDLSKIESHKLDIEIIPTDLPQTLADVQSVLAMLAQEKNLSFRVDYEYPVPRHIHTDPTRFKQILLNVCSNAIKFTEKGSVQVTVKFLETTGKVHVIVADTGIGISPDQISRLFLPFSQADSTTTRRFGGTGLGLYISKQLAEMLGGAIEIQSVRGLGTRVEISIDAGNVSALDLMYRAIDTTAAKASSARQDSTPLRLYGRVLVAEDSPDNQKLIRLYLKNVGLDATIADNGKNAVERALSGDFDLVLMDMQMPIMDGIEATQLLRRTGYATPIVALTANAFREDRVRCANAGCNDFLTKPIDRHAFYQVLGKYLGNDRDRAQPAEEAVDPFEDDLYELAVDFIGKLPGWVADMRAAHEARDFARLETLVHQLKGLGGTFGYPAITTHAGDLNRDLRGHATDHLAPKLEALYGVCAQSIEHFNHRRRKSA